MSNVYTRRFRVPRVSRNGRIYPGGSTSVMSTQGGGGGSNPGALGMYRVLFDNSSLDAVGDDRILTITHDKATWIIDFTVWDNNNEEVIGLRKVKTSVNEAKIYINDVISGIWSVNITYTV